MMWCHNDNFITENKFDAINTNKDIKNQKKEKREKPRYRARLEMNKHK